MVCSRVITRDHALTPDPSFRPESHPLHAQDAKVKHLGQQWCNLSADIKASYSARAETELKGEDMLRLRYNAMSDASKEKAVRKELTAMEDCVRQLCG